MTRSGSRESKCLTEAGRGCTKRPPDWAVAMFRAQSFRYLGASSYAYVAIELALLQFVSLLRLTVQLRRRFRPILITAIPKRRSQLHG